MEISQLPTAPSIDPINDLLPIVTTNINTTSSISRNSLLNLASQPVGISDTQTLTNKTFTSPTISSPTLSGTLSGTYTIGGTPTFPTSVTQNTATQTLTNKTLTSPTINSPTITNASLTADTITGYTTSNTGTIYGMSVTSGVLASAALAGSVNTAALQTNAVGGPNLATSAITLGYAQITSPISTTSTSYVQATGLTATVTIPAGGRKIKITAQATLYNSTSGQGTNLSIWDGTVGTGTLLQATFYTSAGVNYQSCQTITSVVSPAAGSKTYNVGYSASANTANINASTTLIPFILVEAI